MSTRLLCLSSGGKKEGFCWQLRLIIANRERKRVISALFADCLKFICHFCQLLFSITKLQFIFFQFKLIFKSSPVFLELGKKEGTR